MREIAELAGALVALPEGELEVEVELGEPLEVMEDSGEEVDMLESSDVDAPVDEGV